MRIPIAIIVALGMAGEAAGQFPRAAGNRAPAPPLKLDELLDSWERSGATLKSLEVSFSRKARDLDSKAEAEFEGRALLRGGQVAFLNLEVVDPRARTKSFYERIVLTDAEVFQYVGQSREVLIYPIAREQRARAREGRPTAGLSLRQPRVPSMFVDSFAAIEGGPLPFAFNVRAADLKRRFAIRLSKESAKTVILQLDPVAAFERRTTGRAYVELDKTTRLPVRVFLSAPGGKQSQTYTFKEIRPSAPDTDADLRPKLPDGWKVVRDPRPDRDAQEAPPAARARR